MVEELDLTYQLDVKYDSGRACVVSSNSSSHWTVVYLMVRTYRLYA